MLSLSVAAATVLGACLSGAVVEGQGLVAGTAAPGTMADTFTIPYSEYDDSVPSGCGTTFTGCGGVLFECTTCSNFVAHEVNGTITVIDDCTFRVQGWQFDGKGPAVEWWGAKQDGVDESFPYPETAMKIGELGAPGAYQLGTLHGGDSDVVVRLGKDAAGNQIELSDDLNHISVWCEDFMVDFGNAALKCDGASPAAAPAAAPAPSPAATGAGAGAATPPAGAGGTPQDPAETEEGSEGTESSEGSTPAAGTVETSDVLALHPALGAAAALGVLGAALL